MRQQLEKKIRETSIDFRKSDIKLLLDFLQQKKAHLEIQTEKEFSIRQLQINNELPNEIVELLQIKVYDKIQNIKKCLEIFLTDYVEELVDQLKKYADIFSRLFSPNFILKVFDSYYLDEDKIFYVIEYEDFDFSDFCWSNLSILCDAVKFIKQFISYNQCISQVGDYNFQLAQIQIVYQKQENQQFQTKLNVVNPILFNKVSMRRNDKQKINKNPQYKLEYSLKQQIQLFNQDQNLMMSLIEKSQQKAVMSNLEIIKSHVFDNLNVVEDYFEFYFEDNFFAYFQQNKLKKCGFNIVCHKFDKEDEARQIYQKVQEAISICNQSKTLITPVINSQIISNSQGFYILSKLNNLNQYRKLNNCNFAQIDEIQDILNNFILLAKLKINCQIYYDFQQKKLTIDSCFYFREFPINRSSIKKDKNNFTSQYGNLINQAADVIRQNVVTFDIKIQDSIQKKLLDYFYSLEKGDWLASEQKINKINLFFDQLKSLNCQFKKENGISFKPMFLQSGQALQIDEIKIEQFMKLIDVLKQSSFDIKLFDLKSCCRLMESFIFRNQKPLKKPTKILIEDMFVDDSILKNFPNYPINYIQLIKTQNENKYCQLLSNSINIQNNSTFSNENGDNQSFIKPLNQGMFSGQQNQSLFNNPSQPLFSSMTNQNTKSVFSNQNGDNKSSIRPLNQGIFSNLKDLPLFNNKNPDQSLLSSVTNQNSSIFSNQNGENKSTIKQSNDGIFSGKQNESLFNNPSQTLFIMNNQNTKSAFSNQNGDNKSSIQTLNQGIFSDQKNLPLFNNKNPDQSLFSSVTSQNSSIFSNQNGENKSTIKQLNNGIFSGQQNQSLFNNPFQSLFSSVTNQNTNNVFSNQNRDNKSSILPVNQGIFSDQKNLPLFINNKNPDQSLFSSVSNQNSSIFSNQNGENKTFLAIKIWIIKVQSSLQIKEFLVIQKNYHC
ncbi:hypothetical protein TTHERM_00125170 (macronuclear) [Tetrahymena thermophila SB210]|uniref:Uncharacterized protein n=1 Tax=Tetrahymena thermophila (strain SB210) TaxID=312017 RepID=I7M7T3_TETTS|nr:hypothetical protein TTHERM_00125170 [Tetrahymena thermophila SB210]EAR95951.2 hypothetical protein TTHERM_00125170 [Tetrahymena thermophila SB210]|eukprot:XP_001016196.2 hypothetical protein TTHERM_00125170 [Tetrahymena thermophila SB210]